MPTQRLNGVQLSYQFDGAGDPVVLTHGSWANGSDWQATIPELQRDYRVISWDRRGHGRSEDGEAAGSVAEDVADLAALIEYVADGPVHAVGNSYGAVVTLGLMTSRPDLVRSVAVHEPSAIALLETSTDPGARAHFARLRSALDTVRSLLESGRYEDGSAHFMDYVLFGPGAWEQVPDDFRASMLSGAPMFLDELRDPAFGTVDLHALAKSDIPLLITTGSDSPEYFGMIVNEIAAYVPRARIATIAGAGHVPHFTHPVELAAALTGFYVSLAE